MRSLERPKLALKTFNIVADYLRHRDAFDMLNINIDDVFHGSLGELRMLTRMPGERDSSRILLENKTMYCGFLSCRGEGVEERVDAEPVPTVSQKAFGSNAPLASEMRKPVMTLMIKG